MSAVAGVIGSAGNSDPEDDCRSILAELLAFGPDDQNIGTLGEACFGRALFCTVPEDRFDRQPLIAGRYLIVLDCRIDNRAEVAMSLGLPEARACLLSDSAIAGMAWDRWQVGAFDYILGDVALAVWDAQSRTLTLARSPMSAKPLFYSRGSGGIAFASMPQALFAVPWLTKRPDFDEAAATAAGFPSMGAATMFEGVQMIRHGQAVELSSVGERHRCLWDPSTTVRPASLEECASALAAELDRSVKAQMRRIDGPVACHLSSGRDSSAVATSAALTLHNEGQDLLALTGAPSAQFQGKPPPIRIADESALAATTAALHTNIQHLICRSRPRPIARELRQATRFHWRPITHLTAHSWTSEVDEEASRRGAKILLIGSAGNFSLSPSGPRHLADLLREQGLGRWWPHARAMGGASFERWRNIMSLSFGPFMPEFAFRLILKAAGRPRRGTFTVPVLRQPYRESGEALLRKIYGDARPPRNRRRFNRSLLLERETADKMSLVLCGLDVRDPTADRRLAELALSTPAHLLVSTHSAPSPVYERAFSARLPREVLDNRKRGTQGADWYETLNRDEVRASFREYGGNPVVSEVLDIQYIDRVLDQWPTSGRTAPSLISDDQLQALGALAIADFLDLHFPK
jgi:asparagine synthase (glutamine-hydrolysing)